MKKAIIISIAIALLGYNHTAKSQATQDTASRTIHIFVALCDNKYQGIVPVPAKIGNGQDPNNNLYWGCGYGIRTYFKKSKEWKLIRTQKLDSVRLERLVFRHVTKNYYLIADAYNGKYIKQCTQEFLRSSSGKLTDTLQIDNKTVGIAGNSQLVAYIGHDGLMDFQLTETFQNTDRKQRDVIILACYSKRFFAPHLKTANVNPLVWTSGLMCPEAYTIHDAIVGYINGESNENIRNRAALAYSTYQKCSEKAARNLLITGW
ncbi:hypothetical protein FACS189429_2080 [Bacteroidia bacterium]|nr:hypothetical protein FACS189429_2080 [Bacteroidia bacterium]